MSSYRLDTQVGYVLRQVSQRHTAIFARRIQSALTPMQWAVLARLYEIGTTPQTALGRAVSTDAATAKGAVDRLLKRKLVERVRDPADGRRQLVALTATGRTTAQRNFARAEAITRETLAPLSDREAATLLRLLGRLR